MRALGVPLLGLSIPQITGALKPLTWEQPGYWLGVVLFLVFAFVVWQGNRWILLQLRDRFDWLQRPRQRIAALLVATFLYTVPSTLVAYSRRRLTSVVIVFSPLRKTEIISYSACR